MNVRACVCYLLFGLLLCGCRNNGHYDLMQRELRVQEDRIYELESYIEQYQRMLEDRESGTLALESSDNESRASDSPPGQSGRDSEPSGKTPSFEPPEIELGTPNRSDSATDEPSSPGGQPDLLPSLPRLQGPLSFSAKRRWERKKWLKTARRNPPTTVAPPWKPNQRAPNQQAPDEQWKKNKKKPPARPEPSVAPEQKEAKRSQPASAAQEQAQRPRWQPYR